MLIGLDLWAPTGYNVYGVQTTACLSSGSAEEDYQRQGPSEKCVNGLGGPWANSVYRIYMKSK